MWKCKHCKEEFDFTRTTEKANHSRHCSKNPAKAASYVKIAESLQKKHNTTLGEKTDFEVECSHCGTNFTVRERSKTFPAKTAYYCSRSCANANGGLAKGESYRNKDDAEVHYRTVCERHHTMRCIICAEENIIEVHHYDFDHSNDDFKNLVPMCPTHHQYVHSRFRHLVQSKIDEYVSNLGD